MSAEQGRHRAVVIGTSLGGMEALQVVLGGLATELPVPVLVVQHLGVPSSSTLAERLGRQSPLAVEWAADGATARAGHVYLCPPRQALRLEPDGTLTVRQRHSATSAGQVDELFESAAQALGPGLLAVVLTGAGADGARGARAVHDAGGTVVAQDELTSTAFGMPSAVIAAGIADLVLPIGEISDLLDDVVGRGRRLPLPEVLAAEAVFAEGGGMGALMAGVDWSRSALGPVERWTPTLRTTLATVLASGIPMALLWGRAAVLLYNDAYRDEVLGDKHPAALGRSIRETWPEGRDAFDPLLAEVWAAGRAVLRRDRLWLPDRGGRPEEQYSTFSCSPVRDGGEVAGVLCAAVITTGAVHGARRLRTLHRLAAAPAGDDDAGERAAAERAAAVLADNPSDVPFALLYLPDATGRSAHLAAAAGLEPGCPAAPHVLSGDDPAAWPVPAVLRARQARVVDDVVARFPGLTGARWTAPPGAALVLPAGDRDDGVPAVVAVLGASSRIPLDADYRSFLELVAEQVAASVQSARRRRDARERIAALAELDRAKTAFFANVSHEFRTPLTLMLPPLEDLLADPERLGAGHEEAVRLMHRNALRLLKLVDALLDTARIEQGRLVPSRREVPDLSALTAELAGVLRPAIERAGLTLEVDCPPLGEPVWLDPGMWERIVLNLLSNALKHTFHGTITVALRMRSRHLELEVADTGVGIPEEEIPELFTRFHRVRGVGARSPEGSGIGLALVKQLVQLHGGGIRVRSAVGQGTSFTVWLSLVSRRGGVEHPDDEADRRARRRAFAEEAELWRGGDDRPPAGVPESAPPAPAPPGPRQAVLLVDDDADLRGDVRRVLADRYDVTAVATVGDALDELARRRVDLVLTDVMVPELEGLELLRRIRTDPRTRATPVILLAAVADARSAVRGLAAGAHDYIVKPFTARELIARVDAQLALAQLRAPAVPR